MQQWSSCFIKSNGRISVVLLLYKQRCNAVRITGVNRCTIEDVYLRVEIFSDVTKVRRCFTGKNGETEAKKGDCKLSFLSFFCSFFISSGNIEQKPAWMRCSRLLQIVPVMLNYFSISYIYVYIHLMFSCENISFVCIANSPLSLS